MLDTDFPATIINGNPLGPGNDPALVGYVAPFTGTYTLLVAGDCASAADHNTYSIRLDFNAEAIIQNDTVSFSTCSPVTRFVSVLSLFDGCPSDNGIELACNNDGADPVLCDIPGSMSQPTILWNVSVGQTYFVRVSGNEDEVFEPNGPSFELIIEEIAGPVDCNGNSIANDLEVDCDGNGVPDDGEVGIFDGFALDFDGDGARIDVPTSPSLDFTNSSVSFEVWAYRNSTNTEDRILEGAGLFVGFFGNNRFFFGLLNGGGGVLSNETFLDTNVWQHWAGSYDDSTGISKLY